VLKQINKHLWTRT